MGVCQRLVALGQWQNRACPVMSLWPLSVLNLGGEKFGMAGSSCPEVYVFPETVTSFV